MRARQVALGAGAAVVAIAVGLSGLWLPPSPAQIEWCLAERPALLREAERVMIETLGSVTDAYEREDARTVNFPVTIAKDGEAVVRYRVRYRW